MSHETIFLITLRIQGGANVILLARREDALAKVAAACTSAHQESGLQQGGKFATVQLDVSDTKSIANLWSKVPQELRDVDILGRRSPYLFGFRVSVLTIIFSQQCWLCPWSRTCRRHLRGRHRRNVRNERPWSYCDDPAARQR